MENFVLYEEIGKGNFSVVYKGRRKGTISFLAIHCIDKCRRGHITNQVRLTHEIDHPNIVKFIEWYETSNHLWLVVELCTGGSLQTLISQDGHLPESCVRQFGVDIVDGMYHLHTLGVVYSDLKPSKILIDGPGRLKLSDFGLARAEGEDLESLFEEFNEGGDLDSPENSAEGVRQSRNTLGSPSYMAPELFMEKAPSIDSDLWSLGCVFYEMFAGHPPFLAESHAQLVDKISYKDFPTPKVKGRRVSSKPSPDFLSLLGELLKKDPADRIGWNGLVVHPFWQGSLLHLAKDFPEVQTSVSEGSPDNVKTSTVFEHHSNSVLGHVRTLDFRRSLDTSLQNVPEADLENSSGSMISEALRPKHAALDGTQGNIFTLSSRPSTACQNDEKLTSPHKLAQSPLGLQERATSRLDHQDEMQADQDPSFGLIYHATDWLVTSIIDNSKIQKPQPLKYDSKTLMVPPYSVEKILTLSPKDMTKHMNTVVETLNTPEKGPPSQRRMHFLNYVAVLANNCVLANILTKNNILRTLAKQLKESSGAELKIKLSRIIGLTANNTTDLDEDTTLSEPIANLTEVVRDNFRSVRLKQAVLPALGELMFLVASQEEAKGSSVDQWSIPSTSYTIVTRCLREGEDAVVNHYAAKIVENIAATSGTHVQKFVANEMGLSLWYLFTHSTVDALRITVTLALCRITKHSVAVFQSVIDKVGLPNILDALVMGISRVQQAVITMFAVLISSAVHLQRLMQDKDFVYRIMRLLESPNIIIRAKAFLVIHQVIKNNNDMLLVCCQNRLVMYIERDSRRQASGKPDNHHKGEYHADCLLLVIEGIQEILPKMMKHALDALEAVYGRKHPSTVQVKQLRTILPMMPCILHLFSSQVFRPRIITIELMQDLASLLHHVQSIDAGETSIESSSGSPITEEFLHTVMSVIESLALHPNIVVEHSKVVIDSILPPLAVMVSSPNGDMRGTSLRLFSELSSTFLGDEHYSGKKDGSQKLHYIVETLLLPQFEQILLDQDPLPSYGLKLLLALMEQHSPFIKQLHELGLVAVIFQVLVDHQNNPLSSTMASIIGVLNCLVSHKDADLSEIYDQGLVEHVINVFMDVATVCMDNDDKPDPKAGITVLQLLLDLVHTILKNVSDVVRKALQAKKSGKGDGTSEAEHAEKVLLSNKPFTDLTSAFTQLLCHEDADIRDLACKCLSLLIQLYGAENADCLSRGNMDCYEQALKKADNKKQKIILRIIKRLVSAEAASVEMMVQNGASLAETLRHLSQTASSHADVALSSLASEILKISGYST